MQIFKKFQIILVKIEENQILVKRKLGKIRNYLKFINNRKF